MENGADKLANLFNNISDFLTDEQVEQLEKIFKDYE